MFKGAINLLKNFGYRHVYQGTSQLDYQLFDDKDRLYRYVNIKNDWKSYDLRVSFYEDGEYLGKNIYRGLTKEETHDKLELLVNGGMRVEDIK